MKAVSQASLERLQSASRETLVKMLVAAAGSMSAADDLANAASAFLSAEADDARELRRALVAYERARLG